MVEVKRKLLSVQEFLALPETDVTYELVNGEAIPKMSPKLHHSAIQRALLFLMDNWCQGRGRIEPEWAVMLERSGEGWVPIPDLIYISYALLPREWMHDEACPLPPELVVEIISPGQTFGLLAAKASDYLAAGVLRVWVVDNLARSITVFFPDRPPVTYQEDTPIQDNLFAQLDLTAAQVFSRAGLSGN
ncbi:Uma2 family endonuclease [Gloeobacter morelensis]|uniref:Uma2 family endonuclease n=1 Tax=Gloeobacter morelensis MG652769 TaxID=2781736 RepID=A0ABY3PJJ6_9CYAN|nr:Uma2 family endonuclease [Gloeobacter morelensis]UFP93803.1 Uma2 family endonuclease [Gloeobacter morelensis MG652769]